MIAARAVLEGVTPEGLSRVEAARYAGYGTTTFDKMVAAGELPKPRRSKISRRLIWLRSEIDQALRDLPIEGEDASSEWDDADL